MVLFQLVSQMACLYLRVFQTAYLTIFQIIYLRDHHVLKEVSQIKELYHMVVFQLYHIHQVEHQDNHIVIEVNLIDLQMNVVNRVIFNKVFQVFHRV